MYSKLAIQLVLGALALRIEVLSQIVSRVKRQTEDFNAGGLPSHLPSPPEHSPATSTEGRDQAIASIETSTMSSTLNNEIDDPYAYYQYAQSRPMGPMQTEKTPNATKDEKDEDDDDDDDDVPAPFGLDETILILVPQFKYTIEGFPEWCGASVRLSLPITIFFDEMEWPKSPVQLRAGFGSFLFNGPWGWGAGGLGGARRSRSILSLPPPDTLRGGERATLIPKAEGLLRSLGLGKGRACLLRSVCEIHEASVERSYGFLGEVLKQIFSISRSQYAETHLASYLAAEDSGREGNCSAYHRKCPSSLFE